jgi:hypothetical protein
MKTESKMTDEKYSTAKSPEFGQPRGSACSNMSNVLHTEPTVADVEHFFLQLRDAET